MTTEENELLKNNFALIRNRSEAAIRALGALHEKLEETDGDFDEAFDEFHALCRAIDELEEGFVEIDEKLIGPQ